MGRVSLCNGSEPMKPIAKIALATSTAVCATLFSLNWSEQGGTSLSVENAQARVGRPLTPVSVAGVARRQNRRAAYGYGGYGYGVAGAAAIGTGAAVAATRPWGWGGGPYAGTGYYGGGAYAGTGYDRGPLAARAAYYGDYGSYGAGPTCTPGTYYIAADGLVQLCK